MSANKLTAVDLHSILSESRNRDTMDIDQIATLDILRKINAADHVVPQAIAQVLPDIEKVVEVIVQQLQQGGRLIYIGAGTSGRLGVLDAVECRPTFSVSDDLVMGIIAGGERALIHAVEGAEDNSEAGKQDLQNITLTPNDMVLGIAEFEPHGRLLPHRHDPAEFYLGLEGAGTVTIDGTPHEMRPGVAIYVPANAEHSTQAGPDGLRFAYGFAAPSFEQITYRFSAATEARG